MVCSKCGAQLPDDAKFCSKCGNQTQGDATPAMTKWEYNMVCRWIMKEESVGYVSHGYNLWEEKSDETACQQINKIGLEGWELVSAVPISSLDGKFAGQTTEILFVMKRPIL